jgi:GNAT superfamily N-acetyltransferase
VSGKEKQRDSTQLRRVALDDIVDLRHRILRQGLPREAAIFNGDRNASSLHFGAFADSRLIGCATLHLNQWEAEPAWQLRGMAVDEAYQRTGVGADVLRFIESDPKVAELTGLLWCNARVSAALFYVKLGWQIVSEEFVIPTAGPHFRMVRRIKRMTNQ